MGIPAYVTGFHSIGYHTESAGTVIQENIPGQDGRLLGLTELAYAAGATAHSGYLMYPGSLAGCRTTAAAAAAAAQKDLVVSDAPTDPAGNAAASGDIIAYYTADGWEFNTVASISGTTITLTNNIASAVLADAKVRIFGVVGDGSNFKLSLGASATTEYGQGNLVLAEPAINRGDPMVLYINNATNAGELLNALLCYMQK